jgi:hypothetical protein
MVSFVRPDGFSIPDPKKESQIGDMLSVKKFHRSQLLDKHWLGDLAPTLSDFKKL